MASVDHWSTSRFMLWDQCPGSFKERYIDGVWTPPTEAMAFGSAVHAGLEEHFRGGNGDLAFRRKWKEYGTDGDYLTATGLDLLDLVYDLNLSGSPEWGFELQTPELGANTIGFIDLVGSDGIVYDFKTTRGKWSQARAQKELWQPLVYTLAVLDVNPDFQGDFEYIVLNRDTRQLDRFRREWTADEWVAEVNAMWDRARIIGNDCAADRFECHGKHGFCPECGDRWQHGHTCGTPMLPRVGRAA
jgi:hypothetical protein